MKLAMTEIRLPMMAVLLNAKLKKDVRLKFVNFAVMDPSLMEKNVMIQISQI